MRPRKVNRDSEGKYLKLAVGFSIFFVGILLFLLAEYIITQVTQSRYDGMHPFVIALPQHGPNQESLIIRPADRTATRVTLTDTVMTQLSDISVSEPIEGPQDLSPHIAWTIYNTSSPHVSSFDALRLWFLLRAGVSLDTKTISVDQDLKDNSPFWDNAIVSDNKTIQIINASDTTGAGSVLSNVLSEYGFGIISVETGLKDSSGVQILASKNSYTLQRLAALLRVKPLISDQSQGIADIVIIRGNE